LTIIKEFDYFKAIAKGRHSLNVLGLILFCFVFGGVLASMGEQAESLTKIFEVLNAASIRMIKLVMLISPVAICSLIVSTVLEMKDPGAIFERISLYMVTVIVGLLIHGTYIVD
jgi:Na+/H+-dicarboxylate symporter